MQYFIGVVPPPEYGRRIIAFQRKWIDNRLPDVVEPHVTVIKSPSGLGSDMLWIEKVRRVCHSFSRFALSPVKPSSFGRSVVYLSIEYEKIYLLHQQLLKVASPELSKLDFELDQYVPHLTLGMSQYGMSERKLMEMKEKAETHLLPIPEFIVESVNLFEFEGDKYQRLETIELA